MRSTARLGIWCLAASLALLAASAPAAAAKRITGKLSAPGYTVIALDADGEVASQPTKANGKFKLRPPAKKVSLHLRAADGTYAGPVVIEKAGKKGRKAILGLEAGSKLGKVKVRDGYAKLKRELPDEDVDSKRKARAKRGVPIGAGNFGRVKAKAKGQPGPGQDLDRDGIPGALDIDDDGDLMLDNVELQSPGPGGQRRAGPQPPELFGCGPDGFYCQAVANGLGSPFNLEGTVNVNAGSTIAEIDARSVSTGTLRFAVRGPVAELDCAGDLLAVPPRPGLLYCSAGGTGETSGGVGQPFPECCDLEDPPDGFGTLDPALDGCTGCEADFFLKHGAVARRPGIDPAISQIGSGDLMMLRVPSGDPPQTEALAAINYAFATTPALRSFNDEVGPEANIVYPVAPGDPGTFGNGFAVADGADADGDVELTLTFWRAQRPAIADSDPPGAEWMDLGHLRYTVGVSAAGGTAGGSCPQSTLSSTDPNLTVPSVPLLNQASLEDLSDDQVSSPSNTFTYTLNLSQCLAANGLVSSFDEAGEELTLSFTGLGGSGDGAGHGVAFERQ